MRASRERNLIRERIPAPIINWIRIQFKYSRNDEADHRGEMQGATPEYESMPYSVVVGKFLPRVEDDADGIGETTENEQCEAHRFEGLEQRLQREDGKPAHEKVEAE